MKEFDVEDVAEGFHSESKETYLVSLNYSEEDKKNIVKKAHMKRINEKLFEKELFEYLGKYSSCISSLSSLTTALSVESFLFYEFGEESEQLEKTLQEIKDIEDDFSKCTTYQRGLISSLKEKYLIQETIHLERINNYRWFLDKFIIGKKNIILVDKLIKQYIEEEGDNKFIQIAGASFKKIKASYYNNNDFINKISKKIIITDNKGELLKLPVLKKK